MPWRKATVMSQRHEFIRDTQLGTESFTVLCSRYGISPKTGYKWLHRYREEGIAGLQDRSRRPHSSPFRSDPSLEQRILDLRRQYPRLGGRKIHHLLQRQGTASVPAPSTITDILRREGLIDPVEAAKHQPYIRFEHAEPNQLWQMDFKGHFPLLKGRCHPLTVLDDHSRFCVGLVACDNECGAVVKACLTAIFRRYGLPQKMTMDNGPPWGLDAEHTLTNVTAWLIRLGIRVGHSTPYHPQTQGKDERFHRSLQEEWLDHHPASDLTQVQEIFERWLEFYNYQRPHCALGMEFPCERYQPSPRTFPEVLPVIEYHTDDMVRKVQFNGEIHFKGRVFRIGQALHGYPVAVRSLEDDGKYAVYFCKEQVKIIDLNPTGE